MTSIELRADFPADPASAGQARRFVNSTLRTWDCEVLIDIAELLVSELVSNAILHAGTTIRVAVARHDDKLRVEVTDGSQRGPSRKHYSSMSTTGRGLLLVEEMSADWGVATSRGGKTVWFELAVPQDGRGGDRTVVGQEQVETATSQGYADDPDLSRRASHGHVGGGNPPRLFAWPAWPERRELVGAAWG